MELSRVLAFMLNLRLTFLSPELISYIQIYIYISHTHTLYIYIYIYMEVGRERM